jgi:hypothetical protein
MDQRLFSLTGGMTMSSTEILMPSNSVLCTSYIPIKSQFPEWDESGTAGAREEERKGARVGNGGQKDLVLS